MRFGRSFSVRVAVPSILAVRERRPVEDDGERLRGRVLERDNGDKTAVRGDIEISPRREDGTAKRTDAFPISSGRVTRIGTDMICPAPEI